MKKHSIKYYWGLLSDKEYHKLFCLILPNGVFVKLKKTNSIPQDVTQLLIPGEEIIGVLCHLDVVPTGDGWTYPPFEPTIVDGKIYARGSMDDKGACISSLYALKAIKESGIKLNKKIRLIFGTDEETGKGLVRHIYLRKGRGH